MTAREPDATPRPASAAIVNLGCKVNQSEMEAAARLLRQAGVPLVDPSARADLYLVNTCTVTSTADEKSRAAVRRARRANPDARVVVTGCSVQVDPGAFAAVDARARLVGNEDKAAFLGELEALVDAGDDARPAGHAASRRCPGSTRWSPRAWTGPPTTAPRSSGRAPSSRSRTAARSSAPTASSRGPAARSGPCPRSTSSPTSGRALAAGHREIVLTGINIGTYDGGWSERGHRGTHTASALTLAQLVRRILDETAVERIRLSSIEPQHLDDDLLEPGPPTRRGPCPTSTCRSSRATTGSSGGWAGATSSAEYAGVVDRARAAIPGVAVHADVIAGFPTEDDAAFDRSRAFIDALDLAGLHVFRYSARPGTPATRMPGQVPEPKKRRAAALLAGRRRPAPDGPATASGR